MIVKQDELSSLEYASGKLPYGRLACLSVGGWDRILGTRGLSDSGWGEACIKVIAAALASRSLSDVRSRRLSIW